MWGWLGALCTGHFGEESGRPAEVRQEVEEGEKNRDTRVDAQAGRAWVWQGLRPSRQTGALCLSAEKRRCRCFVRWSSGHLYFC